MKAENLWKTSLPAAVDSRYLGARLGNLGRRVPVRPMLPFRGHPSLCLPLPPPSPRPSLWGAQRLLQKLLNLQCVCFGFTIVEQDGQL